MTDDQLYQKTMELISQASLLQAKVENAINAGASNHEWEQLMKEVRQFNSDFNTVNKVVNSRIRQFESIEKPGGGRIKDKTEAKPENLVKVKGIDKEYLLDYRAATALKTMVDQARQDGIQSPLLLITSGYRSDKYQNTLYDAKLNALMSKGMTKSEAKKEARTWVASPGSSPHRTGRAVDFYMGCQNNNQNVNLIMKTEAYKWLHTNAINYGFYNYDREPWHWEYNPPAQKM